MKNERILDALEMVDAELIEEAAPGNKPPKKKRRTFLRVAVAAALVIAIGVNIMSAPARSAAKTIAVASERRWMEVPEFDAYENQEEWQAAMAVLDEEREMRKAAVAEAKAGLRSFYEDGNRQFLTTYQNENKLWSPINAYIGLAMAAELTEGETRQQILELFHVEDLDMLRKQVSATWEKIYMDNSNEICVPANSLWLENDLKYNREAMDALAYYYYASVYQGDLGSDELNKEIATWINNNTGNFLEDSTKKIALAPETVVALYSTLYFQSKWMDEFSKSQTIEGVFHTPDGDVQVEYMNKKLNQMYYYWGSNFSAVNLSLKNGSRMWFILPDEGMTVNDVLNDGTYMDMVLDANRFDEWENCKYMKVNLAVPKFDVASTQDLSDGLKDMGATDVFTEHVAEFEKLTSMSPIYLSGANQSVRVQIDEEGVKAAAYIELPGEGAAIPPEEIIDFVLDRPFLFVIENDNIPLFAGCVNNPQS